MTTLADLLPTLHQKTTAGRLTWEEFGEDAFVASLGNALLEVNRMRGSPRLILRDGGGRALETLTVSFGTDPEAANLLNDILDLARRRAYRIDETLDEAKKALDEL
jgi:hypothetical protein